MKRVGDAAPGRARGRGRRTRTARARRSRRREAARRAWLGRPEAHGYEAPRRSERGGRHAGRASGGASAVRASQLGQGGWTAVQGMPVMKQLDPRSVLNAARVRPARATTTDCHAWTRRVVSARPRARGRTHAAPRPSRDPARRPGSTAALPAEGDAGSSPRRFLSAGKTNRRKSGASLREAPPDSALGAQRPLRPALHCPLRARAPPRIFECATVRRDRRCVCATY